MLTLGSRHQHHPPLVRCGGRLWGAQVVLRVGSGPRVSALSLPLSLSSSVCAIVYGRPLYHPLGGAYTRHRQPSDSAVARASLVSVASGR